MTTSVTVKKLISRANENVWLRENFSFFFCKSLTHNFVFLFFFAWTSLHLIILCNHKNAILLFYKKHHLNLIKITNFKLVISRIPNSSQIRQLIFTIFHMVADAMSTNQKKTTSLKKVQTSRLFFHLCTMKAKHVSDISSNRQRISFKFLP